MNKTPTELFGLGTTELLRFLYLVGPDCTPNSIYIIYMRYRSRIIMYSPLFLSRNHSTMLSVIPRSATSWSPRSRICAVEVLVFVYYLILLNSSMIHRSQSSSYFRSDLYWYRDIDYDGYSIQTCIITKGKDFNSMKCVEERRSKNHTTLHNA